MVEPVENGRKKILTLKFQFEIITESVFRDCETPAALIFLKTVEILNGLSLHALRFCSQWSLYKTTRLIYAPVAQMDRATDS